MVPTGYIIEFYKNKQCKWNNTGCLLNVKNNICLFSTFIICKISEIISLYTVKKYSDIILRIIYKIFCRYVY